MTALNFNSDNLGPYLESSKQITLTVTNYLQSETRDISLHSTAKSILAILQNHTYASIEVWYFFKLCMNLGEIIPYNHPLQLKLVGLMEYLNLSPQLSYVSAALDSKDELSGPFKLCSQLSEFVLENIVCPIDKSPRQQVNFSAFAAHLVERHVLSDEPTMALVALHDAFEEQWEEGGESIGYLHDERVLAAAQWILWFGQSLLKQTLFPREADPQQGEEPWTTGKFSRGEGGLSLARWRLWRDGFRAIAAEAGDEKQRHGEECRGVAARAASIMETLEEAMTFQ